jgi:hypothetical protein
MRHAACRFTKEEQLKLCVNPFMHTCSPRMHPLALACTHAMHTRARAHARRSHARMHARTHPPTHTVPVGPVSVSPTRGSAVSQVGSIKVLSKKQVQSTHTGLEVE